MCMLVCFFFLFPFFYLAGSIWERTFTERTDWTRFHFGKKKITSRYIVLNCQNKLFYQYLMDALSGFSHAEYSESTNPCDLTKNNNCFLCFEQN